MNKKIYLLLTVLLAWSFNLKAQTAQIESLTANPGTTVSFDITVGDLPTNVGAVSLFIGYDPNVLTFIGSTLVDPDFAGYIINDMSGSNQVGIQWTNPYGAELNDVLLSLEFQYSNLGGSCPVVFGPGCEFADIDLNSVVVSYANGSISPNAGVATITIDELSATAGPVTVGLTGAGFDQDAGALTLYIQFDPSILQYSGYATTLTGLSIGGDNLTGLVSVAYSNPAGGTLNTTFLTLDFVYDATGSSELVFTGGCEAAYTDLTIPVVSFDNGLISPQATSFTLTIPDVVTTPGNVIPIPINAAGFDPNLAGAVTLFIGYNPGHMEFVNITDGTISGASANVISPGLVGITWSDFNGTLIDGTLLTMNFDYHFGSNEITFEGGCELTDNALNPFPTTYFDGSISPVVGGPEIHLPVQTGTVGQPITFPITGKNFALLTPGAISMFVGYNSGVLTYTGSTPGTLTDYFINAMPGSQIGIQWADYNGLLISDDDVLLTLNFIYNGGVCDLTFNAGCEFAQTDLSIIPVSYFDGGVITGTFFNIKAYLEGPFNGSDMNAYLNDYGLLPLSQPYSGGPWVYSGTESVAAIPNANVVDWVLVEVRESAGDASSATSATMVGQQAAFILKDGSIVGLDGSSDLLFPNSFNDNVYVVVHHRNHVNVMSANALTQVGGVYVYDFRDDQAKAFGSYQKDLGGIFAMYAADIDNDGEIFSIDFGLMMNEYPSFGVYSNSDVDLDSEIFSIDLGILLNNYPLFTSIP
jgi:hypothetical protein